MSVRDWARVLVYVCTVFLIAFVCWSLLVLAGMQ